MLWLVATDCHILMTDQSEYSNVVILVVYIRDIFDDVL